MATKLSALAIVLLVAAAAAVTVSSAHGARTLETAERVASPPAPEGVVDFDVLFKEAAADGPAAAGPDADWDDKAPAAVSGP